MMKKLPLIMISIFTLFLLLLSSPQAGADTIICNNKGVTSGATKTEVKSKCGRPLDISRDTIRSTGTGEWKSGETWTYIIDGCYREFVFIGNTLDRIIDGGAAN